MNRRLASVAALLLMAACADRAQAPTARVVVASQAHVGALLVLDGSGSTSQPRQDGPALELHFHWALEAVPDGSTARIEHADLAKATLVPDVAGAYRVRLVVNDGVYDSAPTSLDFTADDACRPTAESLTATPAAPAVGQDVALLAKPAAACDAEGASTILSWKWTLLSAPAGSKSAVFQSNTAAASFRPDVRGDYVLAVQMTNALGVTTLIDDAKAHLTVTAEACGDNAPHVKAIHSAPAAPNVGDLVQFQTEVEHADTSPPCSLERGLRYEWSVKSLPTGALVELNDPTAANPSFFPERPGDYVFSLVALDDLGHASAPAEHTVSVSTCGFAIPEAQVTAPATAFVGAVVGLGTTLVDTDASACNLSPKYTYQWALAVPPGSHAKLDDASRAAPTFKPDIAGTYTPSVVVTSSNGRSSLRASANVVSDACGSLRPLPSLRAPAGAATAQPVSVSATVVDPNDTCLGPGTFRYAWTFASRPPGSSAHLSGSDAEGVSAQAAPGFVPDRAGDYVVQLVATNHAGLKSLPVTTTITAADCTAPLAVSLDVPSGGGTGAPVAVAAQIADPNEPGPGSKCARPVFPFQYAWRLAGVPAGSHAAIGAPNASAASFVPDVEGSYDVELVVTDAAGNRGTSPHARVTIANCHAPLSASISAPTGAGTGLPVALSATVTDPNAPVAGGACTAAVFPYAYAWRLVGSPAGSASAINEAGASSPSFVPDRAGTYSVQLVVTDAAGNRSPAAQATVTVADCRAPLSAAIVAPTGVTTGRRVALAATVGDPNAPATGSACTAAVTPYAYSWQLVGRPAGSRASLNSRIAAAPTFTPDAAGTYTVQLSVVDAAGNASPLATADIVAAECSAPLTASIVAPAGAVTKAPVAVSASVTDPNDPATNSACGTAIAPFRYTWALVGRPSGSAAALNAAEAVQPSFTPDVPGTYSLTVAVVDAAGNRSNTATADVTVADCGAPLTITPATPTTAVTGVPYALSATISDPNTACGTVLPYRYAWTMLARPPGSTASLNASGAAAPSFTPDVAGGYVVGVSVVDALGNTGPAASVTISAIACNAPLAVSLNLPTGAATGAPVSLGATVVDPNAPDGGVCSALVTPFSYAWSVVSRPAGSRADLNAAAAVKPSFVPDVAGTYGVQLVVTDAAGNRSPPTSGTFTATSCTMPPAAAITAVTGASTGVAVPLTATITDPNQTAGCTALLQPYTYAWALETTPSFSRARLNSEVATSPSFTPDVSGDYVVSLVVTDASGQRSQVARQTITAAICNSPLATVITAPATAATGDTLGFSAAVTDPNDPSTNTSCAAGILPFTYQWSVLEQPAGSQAALNATSVDRPTLVADLGGQYVIGLVVTDANGNQSPVQRATVNVTGCRAKPTVAITSSGGPGLVSLGATVVDANPAACGAGASTSYAWTLLSTPAGSTAEIDAPGAAAPHFLADVPGSYAVNLRVTDARGNLTSVDRTLTFGTCGSGPVVNVSATASPILGQTVHLDARVADTSHTTCGGSTSAPYSYAWQMTRPATSAAVVEGDADATFVPDVAGTYGWSLTVSDAFGLVSTVSGTVTVIDCTLTPAITASKANPVLTYSPVGLTGTVTRANAACTNGFTTRWRVTRAPPTSNASFSSRTALVTAFTPDVPSASWEIRLEVTDAVTGAVRGVGASIATNACGAAAPIAATGISQPFPIAQTTAQPNPLSTATAAYLTGYTLQLDATGSNDPSAACAGPLSYRWSVYARPVNSTSAPTPANAARPSFALDVAGDFVIRLVVSDGRFTSPPSFLHVVVEDPLNDKVPGLPSTQVLWNDAATDPATNNPAIAFYQLNTGTNRYDLKFARCTSNCDTEGIGSNWQITTIDTNLINPADFSLASTVQVSLIYLPTGPGTWTPAVAYKSSVTCDFRYAVLNGATWNKTFIDQNVQGSIGNPCGSIHGEIELRLVGAAGNPAVAYHSHNPLGAKYAVCKTGCTTGTGVTWQSQTINAGLNVGHYITFSVDPTSKLPRLAYQEDVNSTTNPEALHFATCADGAGTNTCANALGTWTDRLLANGNTAYWNSMAVAPNGTVAIALQNLAAGTGVQLWTCTSNCSNAATSTWSTRNIEAVTGGDAVPRLQFDANSLARITYINPGAVGGTKPLRYAVQTGANSFNFFDIDRQVDDGHSSFILTSSGSTHVSYALSTGLKFYPFGD